MRILTLESKIFGIKMGVSNFVIEGNSVCKVKFLSQKPMKNFHFLRNNLSIFKKKKNRIMIDNAYFIDNKIFHKVLFI